jgi:peptidoglycan hydrolase CwlO-like protein
MCQWTGFRMARAAHIGSCQLVVLTPLFESWITRVEAAEAKVGRLSDQQSDTKEENASACDDIKRIESSQESAQEEIEQLKKELKEQEETIRKLRRQFNKSQKSPVSAIPLSSHIHQYLSAVI